MQPAAALVSVPGLQQRHQGGVRGGGAGHVPLRTHLLLRVRRELARSRALLSAQEVDQEMRRRFGDIKLDRGKHEGVSEVQRDHREGRRLQPHGLQEPELQGGLLLGLPRALGAARQQLVQL